MTTPRYDLAGILDDAALLSLEHQLHLEELLGDHSWSADLAAGTFGFSGATPRSCAVHLLGSAAPGPRSWLWAWANPAGYPDAVTGLAAQVRDFGTRHGVATLAEPEVAFDSLPEHRGDPVGAALVATETAKVVTGHWTSYTAEVGGGTRAAFLVDHADFALPDPEPARLLRVLTQGVAELHLTDPRRAVASYADLRGLAPVWSPAGDAVRLTAGGSTAEVRFDDLGRVAGISAGPGRPA